MTVELIAISEALNYVENQNFTNCVILTDSKSALQHLARCASGYSRGVPIAYKILKMIRKIDNDIDRRLRLQWIPSHIGLNGNEKADKLAKIACSTGSNFTILPFYTEILHTFRKKCFNKFKEYFDQRSTEKGIWFKTIQCQPSRNQWFISNSLNRKHIVVLHRLRSGHYPTNKFAFLMRKVNSPNCDVCGTIDDVYHLLVECNKYRSGRNTMIQQFNINKYDLGAFINVLSDPNSEAAKYLAEIFLSKP